MPIDNPSVKWVVIGLVVLLLVPLILMLGMMTIGAKTGSGMVFHMGGMMGGSGAGMMGTGPGMVFGIVWMALVASALIFLIVLLARSSSKPPVDRDKAA